MRAYVYTDKSLERYAGRFVWLSINTEEASNADFLAKYRIPALPTMLVLDATGTRVIMRYVGGASAGELKKFLEAASQKMDSNSDRLLVAAEKFGSEGKNAEAAKLYEAALSAAPRDWPNYGRTAEALILSLSIAKDNERCARQALRLYPRLAGSTSGANIASTGLECALRFDDKKAGSAALMGELEKSTRAALANPALDFSADDRSGLYMSLIEAREAVKDGDGITKLKREWCEFLERAAAGAKTPEQRAVYDSHRLSAYLDLGLPQKAVAMLRQSEQDFPDDYNPPARLAIAYRALRQYDDALAASDRALAKAYGPRRLQILNARADIYLAKGDKAAARKTLGDAADYFKQLPKSHQSATVLTAIEKKLSELEQ
jgi:tetratricopeptide (TPR) repeat protein